MAGHPKSSAPRAGLNAKISAGWAGDPRPEPTRPSPPLPGWPAGSCSSVVEQTRQAPSLSSASSPPQMSAQNRDPQAGHPESVELQFPTDHRTQGALPGSPQPARALQRTRRAVAGFDRVRLPFSPPPSRSGKPTAGLGERGPSGLVDPPCVRSLEALRAPPSAQFLLESRPRPFPASWARSFPTQPAPLCAPAASAEGGGSMLSPQRAVAAASGGAGEAPNCPRARSVAPPPRSRLLPRGTPARTAARSSSRGWDPVPLAGVPSAREFGAGGC